MPADIGGFMPDSRLLKSLFKRALLKFFLGRCFDVLYKLFLIFRGVVRAVLARLKLDLEFCQCLLCRPGIVSDHCNTSD